MTALVTFQPGSFCERPAVFSLIVLVQTFSMLHNLTSTLKALNQHLFSTS